MKKTLCVLLSLLLLLGMTSLAQADEAMTLRLWVRYDDDFSACIADFEALHPGVKIIQEQVGNNYDDLLAKYNTGMQSNDMPNIGVTGQRNGIPQLYDAGWLLPIENYLTAKEMDDVVENFWTRYTYDGKRMSMPFSCTIPGCYVNLTMLHELGYENMPETLDELCEMARKAVKDVDNDGLTDIYGLNTGADIPWYILPMLWSHGGSIRQADGSYHIDTKEMKEILTIYAGLVKDGVIPANQHKTAREDFQNGKSLFLFISCATTSKILTNVNGAFEIGLTSIMKDQTKSIGLGAYGLSIFKDTDEKAAMSAEFIRFMTLPENAIRTCLAKPGPLPFTKTQMADETIMARYEDPYNKAVLAQSDYIQGEGVTPVDAIVWNEIVTLMSKIEADPDLDLDKELSRIQTEMDVRKADKRSPSCRPILNKDGFYYGIYQLRAPRRQRLCPRKHPCRLLYGLADGGERHRN